MDRDDEPSVIVMKTKRSSKIVSPCVNKMLRSRVDRTGGDKPTPFFQIYLDEDGGEREIARFDCPLMLSFDLLHILKKQDFDKWVDNHLHIKQIDKVVTFEISPDPGGIMTRFTLKYEECRTVTRLVSQGRYFSRRSLATMALWYEARTCRPKRESPGVSQ